MKKNVITWLACAGLSVLPTFAATIDESFDSNPLLAGWRTTGESELFEWDPGQGNLVVTWDSSRSNSFFSRPLGTVLTREDDFEFSFDLWLEDVGPANEYLWSFQLAVGFLNIDLAAQPGFLRGTGFDSPNVVEVAYFRADDFGNPATVFPTFISTNSQFNFNPGEQNSTNYTMMSGAWHRVQLTYDAETETATLIVTNLAGTSSATVVQPLNASFSDYRVSSISINSYNHAGQFPGYEGSILGHGRIDNLRAVVPEPPIHDMVGAWNNGAWEITFVSRRNWVYTLQRGTIAGAWTDVSEPVQGTGGTLKLQDASPSASEGFYRVQAGRP